MSSYEMIKNEMINKNFPIKKVSLGEIKYLGENVYSIDGKDFAFTNESEILLDKKLDISIKTKRQLSENGGEKEIAKLRNWMLSRYKKDKILVSSDENGNIANLLPLKNEIIPPSSFFQMVYSPFKIYRYKKFIRNKIYQVCCQIKTRLNKNKASS